MPCNCVRKSGDFVEVLNMLLMSNIINSKEDNLIICHVYGSINEEYKIKIGAHVNEQLLKMNGLSVEILVALSFESFGLLI